MGKIKELMKWVGTDGLLHFLVCYAMMLTLAPIVGIAWSVLATTSMAVFKEVWDFCIQKDNNLEQVLHDAIFDIIGMVAALVFLATTPL